MPAAIWIVTRTVATVGAVSSSGQIPVPLIGRSAQDGKSHENVRAA